MEGPRRLFFIFSCFSVWTLSYVRATWTAGFWNFFWTFLFVQQSLQMMRRSVLVAVAELLMQYLQTFFLQYVQTSK